MYHHTMQFPIHTHQAVGKDRHCNNKEQMLTLHLLQEFLFLPSARQQELRFRKDVEDVIDLLDLQHYRHQVIANLPYGVRKMVEVARALCLKPRLLLLDEPSSGLNPEETEDLSFQIEDINEELGTTIIMVEHDMNLVSRTDPSNTSYNTTDHLDSILHWRSMR